MDKNTIIQGEIRKSYLTVYRNKKQHRLHRFIMEQFLGRRLSSSELVHHINGNKFDNRIENLEVISRSDHLKKHPLIGTETRIKQKYFFDKDILVDLRNKGLNMYKISAIFGCSQPTIFRALRGYGIK